MLSSLSQLNKLRRMGLGEIRVRGQQELSKLSERLLRLHAYEMSDEALNREFVPSARNGTGEGTAALILDRLRSMSRANPKIEIRPHWFPAIAHRHEISELMAVRFAVERKAIIERAERALAGRFDLLGYKDLGFGQPIDWHIEPITGSRTPLVHWSDLDYLDPLDGGDQKLLWELNRHAHFVSFGQAYWMSGDERFAMGFVEQASAWIEANPPTMGVNWASSLEVAFRAIAWLWALHLCAGSRQLTDSFITRLIKSLIAHGRHIESYLSSYYSPNTHLTGEALGLFYLGAALPELRRASGWRDTGLRILLEQLPIQVRNDGVYFEQTSYYHRYTTDFYLHLLILSRAVGIALPRESEERLALLLNHLMWITRPDGTSPLFGDDDGGRLITLGARQANDFRGTLAAGAALYRRGDWKWVAGDAAVEMLWLLGPSALIEYDRLAAEPSREHARAFPESGYFVSRDGWSRGSSYLLIDCGPHGALSGCGHAHADALAIEFAAAGKTWLVDPGTFVYDADLATRNEFRSTAAHNTVTVDRQSQSIPAGPFAWEQSAVCHLLEFKVSPQSVVFEGRHDGYRRLDDPVTHTRKVVFVKADEERALPAFLVIRDRFDAVSRHHYALNYHLASGCRAQSADNRVIAGEPGGDLLTIVVYSAEELQVRIKEGWVSTCYALRAAAPVAVFETEATGEHEFISLICPGAPEQVSRIENLLAEVLGEE